MATAHEPSEPGAPHEHPAAGRRRVAGDAVQRHRERVGEDGVLVVDGVGHREEHRGVGRHQLGVAAGGVARHAGVDAGGDVAGREAPAQAEVAGLAGGAQRRDARGRAGQPRVEHDALADVEALGLGPELGDLGDHLVAHHLRERAQPAHRVVAVAVAEVEEDLLRVRAADAGEERAGHEPVGAQRPGVGDVAQRDRGDGQVLGQLVGVGAAVSTAGS